MIREPYLQLLEDHIRSSASDRDTPVVPISTVKCSRNHQIPACFYPVPALGRYIADAEVDSDSDFDGDIDFDADRLEVCRNPLYLYLEVTGRSLDEERYQISSVAVAAFAERRNRRFVARRCPALATAAATGTEKRSVQLPRVPLSQDLCVEELVVFFLLGSDKFISSNQYRYIQ